MSSRNVSLVSQEIAAMFDRMEPRHIALLQAKILNPDTSLTQLSTDLWPNLGHLRRKQIINDAKLTQVLALVRQKPWLATMIMAGKLSPVAVATLFQLSQTADKDNVRVTAAKELVRLAQSTATQIAVGEDAELATDILDDELTNAESEADELADRVILLAPERAEDDDLDLFNT